MFRLKAFIISCLLFIVLFLSAVEYQSLDYKFYRDFQKKENLKEIYNIEKDLDKINTDLIKFLKVGDKDLIKDDFNNKEVRHLEDCYKIFKAGYILRDSCFIILIILFFINKNDLKDRLIDKIIKYQIRISVFILLFLGLLFMNFSKAFIKFHQIFFDNDLWLLDPNKDLLIQIMPEKFFIENVIRIIVIFVILEIVVNLALKKIMEARDVDPICDKSK